MRKDKGKIYYELFLLNSKQTENKKDAELLDAGVYKRFWKLQYDFGIGDTGLWILPRRSHQTSELTILFQICLPLPFNLPFCFFYLRKKKQQGAIMWEKCQYSAPAEKKKKKCWSWNCRILLTFSSGIKQPLLQWVNRTNMVYLSGTASFTVASCKNSESN